MPAMHYTVRWPDASESVCYSPSLVVRDFFNVGEDYALEDFLRRVRAATAIASDRVRAKYGFACSRAADQLDETERRAAAFAGQTGARVRLLSFADA